MTDGVYSGIVISIPEGHVVERVKGAFEHLDCGEHWDRLYKQALMDRSIQFDTQHGTTRETISPSALSELIKKWDIPISVKRLDIMLSES